MAPKQNLDTGRSGKQSNALYRLVSYGGFVALQTGEPLIAQNFQIQA